MLFNAVLGCARDQAARGKIFRGSRELRGAASRATAGKKEDDGGPTIARLPVWRKIDVDSQITLWRGLIDRHGFVVDGMDVRFDRLQSFKAADAAPITDSATSTAMRIRIGFFEGAPSRTGHAWWCAIRSGVPNLSSSGQASEYPIAPSGRSTGRAYLSLPFPASAFWRPGNSSPSAVSRPAAPRYRHLCRPPELP
jgi:hypothetical protein